MADNECACQRSPREAYLTGEEALDTTRKAWHENGGADPAFSSDGNGNAGW
jgi:hypothetical protein